MWNAIAQILTNSNALLVLIFLSMFVVILIILAMSGLVRIDTGSFKMGADNKERDIIRQQVEWSHSYIMGIESELSANNNELDEYLAKYILEVIFDEIIAWVVFNHINLESDYINIKQEKIKSIIKTMNVKPQYQSKEFFKKTDRWTEEIIRKLVKIREVYK